MDALVGKRYRLLVHLVDDSALLSTSLDQVSSTKVRRRLVAGRAVVDLVGDPVSRYLKEAKVGERMRGEGEWTAEERATLVQNVGTVATSVPSLGGGGSAGARAGGAHGSGFGSGSVGLVGSPGQSIAGLGLGPGLGLRARRGSQADSAASLLGGSGAGYGSGA